MKLLTIDDLLAIAKHEQLKKQKEALVNPPSDIRELMAAQPGRWEVEQLDPEALADYQETKLIIEENVKKRTAQIEEIQEQIDNNPEIAKALAKRNMLAQLGQTKELSSLVAQPLAVLELLQTTLATEECTAIVKELKALVLQVLTLGQDEEIHLALAKSQYARFVALKRSGFTQDQAMQVMCSTADPTAQLLAASASFGKIKL